MDETNVCLAESQMTNISNINAGSDESVCKPSLPTVRTRICFIGDLSSDSRLSEAAQAFDVPVVSSPSGAEFINDGTWDTVFILEEFSGATYDAIHHSEQRILGPAALQQYAEKREGLPCNSRPLYSLAMSGLVICFTGFRKKDELNRLITLIHNMGGSIRKDMVSKVTHLIANSCGGDKYQYAMTFRVPVMSETWVHSLWERRNETSLSATSEEMMIHKLKPFHGARVCFFGFPDDERQHMIEVLLENGGEVAELEDPNCTHVVVDNGDSYNLLKSNMMVPRPVCFPSTSVTSLTPSCLHQNQDCVHCQSVFGFHRCNIFRNNDPSNHPIAEVEMSCDEVAPCHSTPMKHSQDINLFPIIETPTDTLSDLTPRCKIPKLMPGSEIIPYSFTDICLNQETSTTVDSSPFLIDHLADQETSASNFNSEPRPYAFQINKDQHHTSLSQNVSSFSLDSSLDIPMSPSTPVNMFSISACTSKRLLSTRKLNFSLTKKPNLERKISISSDCSMDSFNSPVTENLDQVTPMSCEDSPLPVSVPEPSSPSILSKQLFLKSFGKRLAIMEEHPVTMVFATVRLINYQL